ncbi:hypothetical protein BC828DRAFT_393729 [Blastocladiella britannica]|nr:hypothetical protein BC828DRAFT_393729 [Blastocladiella britannica]
MQSPPSGRFSDRSSLAYCDNTQVAACWKRWALALAHWNRRAARTRWSNRRIGQSHALNRVKSSGRTGTLAPSTIPEMYFFFLDSFNRKTITLAWPQRPHACPASRFVQTHCPRVCRAVLVGMVPSIILLLINIGKHTRLEWTPAQIHARRTDINSGPCVYLVSGSRLDGQYRFLNAIYEIYSSAAALVRSDRECYWSRLLIA